MTLKEAEVTLSFTAWCSEKAQQHPHYYNWSVIMELVYIRSLREGNFNIYIDTLKFEPWFFALDHVHYACWLPSHI